MTNQSIFTVVIPCLNEEKYLPPLLQDLANQSVKNFNVIVVDGKSDDQTVKKTKAFSKNFPLEIVISDQRNVSYQRNLGGNKATTDWIIFFDADNRLGETFFEELDQKLLNSNCGIFTTYITPDTESPQEKMVSKTCNLLFKSLAKVHQPFAFGAIIGVKKSVFNKTNGFNESVNFQEDSDFVERAFKSGAKFSVFSNPKIIYSFRRFRKEGMLVTINKAATIHFKNMLKGQRITNTLAIYPMEGGAYYDPKPNLPQTAVSKKQSKSK